MVIIYKKANFSLLMQNMAKIAEYKTLHLVSIFEKFYGKELGE